ncbi:jg14893 [Pararge aegeria aegeria]|uniref:Jg14893 protein n=1 Tax=Pararge aegeria aegeria TaxID=348720 RepID=A0A8S4R3W4_9NEOP|nr:jg14893 [Pararge aegeria aegeria]
MYIQSPLQQGAPLRAAARPTAAPPTLDTFESQDNIKIYQSIERSVHSLSLGAVWDRRGFRRSNTVSGDNGRVCAGARESRRGGAALSSARRGAVHAGGDGACKHSTRRRVVAARTPLARSACGCTSPRRPTI